MSEVEIDPVVAQIAASIVYNYESNQFEIPHADLIRFAKEVSSTNQTSQLLALTLKYEDLERDHTLSVRAQLLVLMGIALKDEKVFASVLKDSVQLDGKLGAAIGAESSKIPVGHTRRPGSTMLDAKQYKDED